jgi:hypothetical protein
MFATTYLVGAVAALSLASGASPAEATGARWRSGEWVPHLDVHLRLDPDEDHRLSLPYGPARRSGAPPPCVADVCQPRVAVPGFDTKLGRPHRSELFAALLDRAGIEPFASIAWLFVTTGFRLDYAPPSSDAGDPAAAHGGGWGSVFVRLRLRVDPMNHPVIPHRDRAGNDRRRWTALIAPRA